MEKVSLQNRISSIAQKTPDKKAVEWGKKYITYLELEQNSNRIANFLTAHVGEDKKIPVIMEQSISLIEGLLGIIKSGNIFVPIDPNYPSNRIKTMIREIDSDWMIAHAATLQQIEAAVGDEDSSINVILLEPAIYHKENIKHINIFQVDSHIEKNYLLKKDALNRYCYIYFTSGSTGKPKGILGRHRSLDHFIQWEISEFGVNEAFRVSQLTSPSFDPFLRDVFVPLCAGGTLCIPDNKDIILNPEKLVSWIEKNQITLVHTVPVLFKNMLPAIGGSNCFDSLRYILMAGEILRGNDIRRFVEVFGDYIQLVNLYGPTETTLAKFYYRIKEEDINKAIIPVGRPITFTEAMILNEDLNKCEVNVFGEIFIRTPFISSGYFNDRELTKKVFIKNPFSNNEQDIIYKTGDMGRLLPDGNIEIIGRVDGQVKIRGSRIETAEVENWLLKHEAVNEAVVTAWEDKDGDECLCAYVTGNRQLMAKELREYLNRELPEYMVPSYFVQLDKMPLTPNGKIDRRALPEPDGSIEIGTEYEAPRNEIEEKLVNIWQEVLGIEKIGINDNFFELRGHSLKATNMVLKIHKELNIEVPLREVFKTPTIKGLSEYMKENGENIYAAIEPVEEKEYYELSSAQKRLYTLQQLDQKSTSYNMPRVLEIEGKLDVERLEAAFRKLIERHEAFRTSFELIGEEIVQKVHEKVEFEVGHKEAREDVEEILRNFVRPFDLSKAPLLRVGLIKVHPEKHILMCDMHHIISDGTSMGILVKEFVELYEGKVLPELRLQYKDYATWQNRMLDSEIMKKQEEYWLKEFEEEIPALSLPTDYQRPSIQSFDGDRIRFELDEEITKGLRKIEKETGATMYMVLLAGFNILLSRYSGQEDIVVGSPIAGRPHADLENIMGMFVNTLAMRNYPSGEKTIKEFIEEIKTNALRAYENQDYQFEEFIEKLNIRRDMSRNPLFDVMFSMQNIDIEETAIEGISIKPYEMENRVSKFDITLTAVEAEEKIGLSIEYCSNLFSKDTIERMAGHLKNVLRKIEHNANKKICEIDILDEEERHKLLYEFNDTYAEYPKDKTIHELFEEQAARTPDNIAVVYEDSQLTYRELNERVNQLARVLREKGVVPDSIVGIMADRSLEMIVGIMGILKAGGTYLPIDPEYPKDRIEYMLEDSGAGVWLTQKHLRDKCDHNGWTIELDDENIYQGNMNNLENINKPNDLAYVIYTSGSTGKPKGVMIEHHSVINRIKWMQKKYPIGEADVILQKTPYTFDVSVWELFWWSMEGAQVCFLTPGGEKDPEEIIKTVEKHKVTTMHFVPSMLNIFLEDIESSKDIDKLSSLRQVFSSGEALTVPQVERFNRILNNKIGTKLVNLYGPTEATVDVSYFDCSTGVSFDVIPIGKPIDNIRLLVVDKHNNLLPVGIPGELCIEGVGLARGYLNREELTKEKFVENPFKPGTRIYKTGDLARWLPDGNIEFLGRIDHQVKIRGYRIELGEIESQLLKHPGIKEAVVAAKEEQSGDKYLCAYIVADKELTVSELRRHLGQKLADYMIPSYLIQLDKMPLTPNGKVDRKVLPEPDESIETGTEYEAPRNETEDKLVTIWQEVLGIGKIGINDNFFELGGHSLKATSMVSKIHKQLNVEVPLREVFKTPTIKGLVEHISGQEKNIYSGVEPVEEREYYELSSAQKRLYTLQQFDLESTSYNMTGVLKIEGKLDAERLDAAFRKLIERHEAFRTSFELAGEEIVQKIHKEVEFAVERKEAREEDVEEIVRSFICPFDLSKAPLLRVGLVKLQQEKSILMFDMHHIISDGTSMGILTDEFVKLYEGKELSPLRLQYKDYAAWQNKLLRSEEMKKLEEYWLITFEGEIPVLNLPTDYPRPAIQSFEGDSVNFEIDEEIAERLRKIAGETGATMYMVLLAAFNILLSKYSGQKDIVVGSPIAGRPHADLENIMGMFVGTLAMRNYPEGRKTFRKFLEEVKINALKAYENQNYQFEGLLEKLNVRRNKGRNPLFDVMLVLQNTENKSIDIEGLRFSGYEGEHKVSKFDMTINAVEIGKKVGISLEYCTKLFKKKTIDEIVRHLKNILRNVSIDADKEINEIEIMDEEEKNRLLYDFNDMYVECPTDKSVHELFEEQVESTPENIAVKNGESLITYKELNIYANKIAHTILEKYEQTISNSKNIILLFEHGSDMIAGILGVLKAGMVYVALDPEYPVERLVYMIKDSDSSIILTNSNNYIHANELKSKAGKDIDILDINRISEDVADINPDVRIMAEDIAYIMYTSGSTGDPKGVIQSHKNIVYFINEYSNKLKLDSSDKVALFTSYSHTVSVIDIFSALLNGGAIYPYNIKHDGDTELLAKWLSEEGITVFHSVPTLYRHLIESLSEKLHSIRLLILGGETVYKNDIELYKKYFTKDCTFVNLFGSSEVIIATWYLANMKTEVAGDTVPLGRFVKGVKAYILDEKGKQVPLFGMGEMAYKSDYLGKGYWNKEDLTHKVFVKDPITGAGFVYRSGDLCKVLPDGNIDYLGRIDHQVKIRGFRIELGEIENRLLSHGEIKEAVVVAKEEESGSKYLCAYIVGEKELTIGEIRGHLSELLPDYMIPSYFVQLEKMPLTPNGKINRKALPEPDGRIETGVEYEAARNEIEEKLVKVWQEVLKVERVGINDNFFELGGHSLRATSLVSKIHKELDVEVPLREIFKTPTIKGLAEYISGQEENIYSGVEPVEEREYYELSSAQKRLYTLQQFEPESTAYNILGVLVVEGKLELERLKEAFVKLIERHESLRTSFELVGEEIVQRVNKKVEFGIKYSEAREEVVEDKVKEFVKAFDLSKAPLLRVGLVKVNAEKHVFIYDMHHIISDGTSMGILVEEFVKLYEGKKLPPLRLQYKDYAVWQNRVLRSEEMRKQEEYWLKAFEGEIPVLSLPTDYPRPAIQSFEGDSVNFEIEEETTERLRKIAGETGATMYMVLLAAFNILLSKYSGQEDIVVGSPIAGRPHADLENIMGMFVNTLAMRNYPEGRKTFRKFLEELKANALRAYENQNYQYEELVEKLNIRRDMSRNPLFDVMLVLQNTENKSIDIEGLRFSGYEGEHRVSKFDMTINAVEIGKKVGISLEYCTKLFKEETIDGIVRHLKNILRNVSINADKEINEIDILDEEERHKLLYEFNDTYAEYPRDKTIHELFEEQAARTPDNIAVVYEDRQLTYRELNERSNQLARLLRKKGVGIDSIVGIMAERSPEMIVGIMGILKAGGAYLPIDSEYPKDRVDYMLKDSGVGILLTHKQLREKTAYWGETIELDEESIYAGDGSNLEAITKSNDLVYVIYTSGSTGKPKGVMITNSSLANYITWFADKADLHSGQKSLLLTSYAFDLGYTCIFPSILNGLELHILEKEKCINSGLLLDYIHNREITYIKLTPSMFANISDKANEVESNLLSSLRLIVLGGETINVPDIEKFNILHPHVKIMNHYGPTESTIGTVSHLIDFDNFEEYKNAPVIGKPISNACIYIIDKYSNPAPAGIPGELCISGDGLARGYLKRPELTAEKFVPNPFEPGKRMYRTGDLARWLPDGNIEFLGRIDHQVKIRGFRIEPGEIENRLLSHGEIKEALVAAKKDESGSNYLCAYIVGEKELAVSEIRGHLSKDLPDYMIPSYFVQLDKMPLTSNGKIDRKALPEPDGSIETGTEYEAPSNEIEEKLVKIWQEVLKVDKIGINYNFFELGGHSLKATSMVSKIHKQLNVEVPLREVFKTPTIKGLAEYIKGQEENIYSGIEPAEEREYYELSSAQKRLYTLQQLDLESTAYNMPGVLEVEGKLDIERLKEAFRELIKRHEALRTSFELIGEEIVQKIHKEVEFKVEHKEAGEEDVEGILRSFVRPFDLSKAPLLRVGLIKLHTERHILMYDMHHIISDGTSRGILIDEFVKLYEGKELLPLRLQYKDYAVWQNSMSNSEVMKKQEEHWLKTFQGEIPALSLPTDYQRPAIQSFEGDTYTFKFDEVLLSQVKEFAIKTDTTLFMVLLEILSIALSKYSGQEDIIIGTVSAGRLNEETQRLVGLFLNNIAIRCLPQKEKTINSYLKELRGSVLGAYENQDYPIEDLIRKLNIKKDVSRNALFDAMLILQNFERQNTQMSAEQLNINPYHWINKVSDYDLSFYAAEVGNELMINVQYCTRLFREKTIERFGSHFCKIASEVASKPEQQIIDIFMLEKQEVEKVIYEFNNKSTVYEKKKTLHQLFEEQVEKTPENIAVVYEDKHLTYWELNFKANKLARYLKKCGTGENSIVGIMTEKSIEMLVGILAILKAGGAYLPIDPGYPSERISYMLENSQVRFLLTQRKLSRVIEAAMDKLILEDETIYEGSGENLNSTSSSSNLAYIIYTSGTTGKPKGIMIEHRNVIAYVRSFNNMFELTEKDATLQQASITFDGFVEETYSMLVCGGKVVIPRHEEVKEVGKLKEVIDKNKVSILSCSPLILSEFNKLKPMETVHTFLSSSDILKKEYYTNIIKKAKVYNMYGPSETTVCSTCYNCTGEEESKVPIGKPITNYRLYILNEKQQPQPIGVIGEIYISGEGISRGYINKPELTFEKFLSNPFIEGERMYRTGDMARWLENGNIEFIGRTDHQVKIRGYRIEVDEIEIMLLKHENIKEAIVMVREDEQNEKYLVAYITVNRKMTIGEIREYLRVELPEYMFPQYYVQLEKMPLTLNGKIDRQALEEYHREVDTGIEYEAPRNKTEENLVKIWKEVLRVEKVGVNDNFFELGGHSLRATSVIGKINKRFDVEVPLREIFKTPTIKGMAEYISTLKKKEYELIIPAGYRDYYPVSSIQKRIYIIQQFDVTNISYNTPSVLLLEGSLDKKRLEAAFLNLVERHEAFRTSFEFEEEQIVQKIHDLVCPIQYYETDENNISDMFKEFVKPFDLGRAPLIRISLIKTAEERHVLMLDAHHIILDGTSIVIMVDEFMRLYEGEVLEPLEIQYKDYAVWQNEIMDRAILKAQEKYWVKEFEGEIPVLNFPTDFPRPEIQSSEGDTYSILLKKDLSDQLNEMAMNRGVTLFTLLLAIYHITLSKYSKQNDIVVGTVTAGRSREEIQQLVGVFLNNIAFRCKIDTEMLFDDYLENLKETVLNGYENQDYPIEELIERLDLKKDMSRNTLFDVMIILQNFENRISSIKNSTFSVRLYPFKNKTSKCDITLYIQEGIRGLRLNFEYCTRLFKRETIERFAQHFSNMAKEIVTNPNRKIKELDLLSEDEKQQLLEEFNNTKANYPDDKLFHELFEEQVEKTPDKIALVYKHEQMTYRQLNEKSNQLARQLREKGVKNESIVGIMVDRSIEMIISLLAVLKAGGAYLPIDPEYPQNRIEYMLYDSNVKIMLTQIKFAEKLQFAGEIIDVKNSSIYTGDSSNLQIINKSEDLVYVIYTSGTSGKPKGVMVEHRNLINIATGWRKDYGLDKIGIKLLQMASMSFDVFAGDLSRVLLNGGEMIICPSDVRLDTPSLYKLMKEHQINIFESTPALIIPLMEYIYDNNLEIDWLKLLIIGSDSCLIADFRRLLERFSANMRILNSYGVTEATIDSSYYEAPVANIEGEGNVPIGRPMQNTRFYILDENLKSKAIGQYGELYIGGAGVARGYLNKPELTEERFISDPFTNGGRIYKTGDLARWNSNGNVEFLGRLDNQVKIRGYRIELGEIESCLIQHEAIKDAVVVAWGENVDKYLCAYIVTDMPMNLKMVQAYMTGVLPDYMIPSYVMEVDQIPLTPNGKVDRKALPEPIGYVPEGYIYEEPVTQTEKDLVSIWKALLKKDRIGITDNFFEMGGHSLKATLLVGRIYKELGFELPLKEVFKTPTIKALGAYIDAYADKGEKQGHENFVLLKKAEAQGKNLFLIHDISGDVNGYRDFCSSMKTDINCWGIKANMRTGYGPVWTEVKEIAASYVEKLKDIQPEGPYYLGGWSIGGIIAFEMAVQIEQQGHKIDGIWLFDTDSPSDKGKEGSTFSLAGEMKFISGILPDNWLSEKAKTIHTTDGLWLEAVNYMEKHGVSVESIINLAPQYAKQIQVGIKNLEINEIVRYINMIRTINRAVYDYKPSTKIKARVYLIKAKDSSWLKPVEWETYIESYFEVAEIDGDHFNIFGEPNVHELTKNFDNSIHAIPGYTSLP